MADISLVDSRFSSMFGKVGARFVGFCPGRGEFGKPFLGRAGKGRASGIYALGGSAGYGGTGSEIDSTGLTSFCGNEF
jgi:hypothetical protein